jgi:hypothetical protein
MLSQVLLDGTVNPRQETIVDGCESCVASINPFRNETATGNLTPSWSARSGRRLPRAWINRSFLHPHIFGADYPTLCRWNTVLISSTSGSLPLSRRKTVRKRISNETTQAGNTALPVSSLVLRPQPVRDCHGRHQEPPRRP